MSFNTLTYYWREAFASIFRNSWLSIASVGTVAVSLLILGFFSLLVVNANNFTRDLESGLEIRAFLKDGQSKDSIKKIKSEIDKISGISMAEFIPKEQALEEMKKSFGNRKEVLEGLQNDNPLPDGFRVRVSQADQIPVLAGKLSAIAGVDQVVYGHGLVERLVTATKWVRLAGVAILVFLCIAAIFLISTTTRMSVFARRKEIGIMILLGATNWFVRFPYILEGMILGFVGAVFAASAVYVGYISLSAYLEQSLPFVQPITDQETILTVLGGIMGMGLLIGAIGSSFSIRKFLKI